MIRGLKSIWHLIAHPYAFFEEMIARGNCFPATITFLLALLLNDLGWIIVSGGKYGFSLPDILWPLVSYPIAALVIYGVCRLLISENRCRTFFAVWGFSYLPTLLFFLSNIFLHTLTKLSFWNRLVDQPSVILIFWAFTLLMLLWKILFLAITLRLAGNLNLSQILVVFVILITIMAGYWVLTLTLGLAKIPFV